MKTDYRVSLAWLIREIEDQEKWIRARGGTRASYVKRYGSHDDPDRYGNGGEAIFAADQGYLDSLRAMLKARGGSR